MDPTAESLLTDTDAHRVWQANPHLQFCHADFGAFAQSHSLQCASAREESQRIGEDQTARSHELRALALARLNLLHNPATPATHRCIERRGTRLVVWLYGPIGHDALQVDTLCDGLNAHQDVGGIVLRIASAGGYAEEAIRIAGTLRNHPARVVAIIDRFAYSAASAIASVAHRVLIRRSAMWMAHTACVTHTGNADTFHQRAISLRGTDARIATLYANRRRRASASDIHHLMSNSSYLNAEQAVAAGVCDDVIADLPLTWSHTAA